jgi:hypothetical protein
MSNLPEFLTGSITDEFGDLSLRISAGKNVTGTCGSECSNKAQCEQDTCPAFRPGKKPVKKPVKKKAFFPVVEGWNEPPAAQL